MLISARDPQVSLLSFHIKKVTFTANISVVKQEGIKSVAREAVPSVFFPRESS